MASPPSPDRFDISSAVAEARRRSVPMLESRLGIDARALAVFRIALGFLVVGDLLFRARELTTFYTDRGVLPRSALAELFPMLSTASLHTVSGSAAGQGVLFAISGCLAVLLVIGYRTRAVTVGVLLLHASLYARNPYVLNGGDGLLVIALFLGVFLPLGERYSIGAVRRGREPRDRTASLATAAVLLQMVIVYVANVPFKLRSDVWMAGDGVQYALELEQFAVHLGPHLTAYPALLTSINWLWVGMMALSPLLILATGRLRATVAAGFITAHLGMLATMRLGLFPLVVISFLLLYLPPSVWDRLERLRTAVEPSVTTLVGERIAPVTDLSARTPPSLRRGLHVTATVVLVVFLLASVLWPVTALGVGSDSGSDPVVETDGYVWTLFAPNTPTTTRWFVAPATLESGERIDAFHGGPVEWEKPPDAADMYPSALWHRYLNELRFGSEAEQRQLAAYFCRQAGVAHDATVAEVSIYVVEQRINAAGGGNPMESELVSHDCHEAV